MKCNFCQTNLENDDLSITDKDGKALICTRCVRRAQEVIENYQIQVAKDEPLDFMTPSEIKSKLDEYVIGQEQAKKILSVAIYNHYKMLEHDKIRTDKDVQIQKSNILLLGPTGSGKTYLLQTIAKVIDVPFAIADATSITEAGYVGEDAETMLKKLIQAADGDIERAERGIIFIDEIDKLSRKSENPSITRDVGGEGVQNTLLKIIEGNMIDVPQTGLRKHPNADCWQIDTSKILFVCGGSFEGIEKIVEQRLFKNASIGFGMEKVAKKEISVGEAMLNVKTEDIRKFGIIPELLGRLPVIAALHELDKTALVDILVKPHNAIFKQYKALFDMDKVALKIERDALEAIAEEAIKRKTGARSLRSIMEEFLLSYMYTIPDKKEVEKLVITKEHFNEFIQNPKPI